jgi:hypothetical protein
MAWGENLNAAIDETVQTLATMETDWDSEKLSKKLREYFNKGAKNMTFNRRKLPDLIAEYTNNAMGSVFAGLGDREWLTSGQADFLMVIDAGIKDHFPAKLLANVEQLEFEQQVLAAYDQAFEENRFCPILSEAVPTVVSGPKIKKKVWNAVEAGRKAAQASGTEDVAEFTSTLVDNAIKDLSENSFGSPESTMTAEQAVKLFVTLLEAGALPLALQAANPQPPVHILEEAVTNAYAQHTIPEGQDVPAHMQPKKKQKHSDWEEESSGGSNVWGGKGFGGKGFGKSFGDMFGGMFNAKGGKGGGWGW